MRKIPSRQVHLDFHTAPMIPGVGAEFDKKQFQAALKEGDLNSITVFAKCHHGLMYYPSKIGRQHPGMKPGFDLTGAMVDACHEIGVDAPIYITVGFCEEDAYNHPEWIRKDKDGNYIGYIPKEEIDADPEKPGKGWCWLCPNGGYDDLIYAETEEICKRYKDIDGLFYDIVYVDKTCYCDACMKEMRDAGLDPYDDEVNRRHYITVHKRFAKKCGEILHKYHPEATIFFNSGGADIYRPEYHEDQTHFEMEDLPTAWGGYDKFIPRACVMSRYGKDYLGMTGKFHSSWGEFGGYKNATALKYELSLMGMYGAACSVGDQMPPSGKMDMSTYKLIGEGYRFYESFEPWFFHAKPTADVGIYLCRNYHSDEGLHKILLQSHIDFDVVMPGDDLTKYKLLILPDSVKLADDDLNRLKAFAGSIILTGSSLLEGNRYLVDNGVICEGHSPYDVDYLMPGKLPLWVDSPFLCYESSLRLKAVEGAEVLSEIFDPYFSRTVAHFCSHKNTPYRTEKSGYAAVVRKGNIITFAHNICSLYFEHGAQLFRDIFMEAVKLLYTPKCEIELPSGGRIHLTNQTEENRYVCHVAYAQPIQRGPYSVIEDMPVWRNVNVKLRRLAPITGVAIANGEKLEFTQDKDGCVSFTIPEVYIYTAIELTY